MDFAQDIELQRSTKKLHARINVGSLKVIAGDEAQLQVRIKVEKDDIDEADIPDQLSDHLQVEQNDGTSACRTCTLAGTKRTHPTTR